MIEEYLILYLGKNLGLVFGLALSAFFIIGTVYLCSKIFK